MAPSNRSNTIINNLMKENGLATRKANLGILFGLFLNRHKQFLPRQMIGMCWPDSPSAAPQRRSKLNLAPKLRWTQAGPSETETR